MRTLTLLAGMFLGHTAQAHNSSDVVVAMITEEADVAGVDANLALAIAKVESNLNPNAIGALGEIGLFQLRPEYHAVRRGDTRHNVRLALKYMLYVREKCRADYPGHSWVNCLNHGPFKRVKHPLLFPYYRKVMSHYSVMLAAN